MLLRLGESAVGDFNLWIQTMKPLLYDKALDIQGYGDKTMAIKLYFPPIFYCLGIEDKKFGGISMYVYAIVLSLPGNIMASYS